MQTDRIELRGLRFSAVHGVHEEERASPQPFEVDLDILVDTEESAVSDDLADTADYSAAADVVAAVMAGPPRRLLESLASSIAAGILEDPHVSSVTVALRKLSPPVPHDIASAGVRITRARP